MASPVSLGDILGIAGLLMRTYNKCKAVSSEYTGIQESLQSTQLLVNSVYYTVKDIYGELPQVFKEPFISIMNRLEADVLAIGTELNEYSNIRPGQGPQLSKLKFSIFQNPQETRSKLDSTKLDLSLWISTVTCYSKTKTPVQYYSPAEMSSLLSSTTPQSNPSVAWHLIPQTVRKWQIAAAKNENSIAARGTFTYTSPDYKGERSNDVAYTLSLQNDFSLYGRSYDSTGEAEIRGSINPQNGSVHFLKNYTKHKFGNIVLLWDYEGCFIQCGIVGEWRYPKGHPKRESSWRGRFSIWLKDEEDDSKEQVKDQP
ncbi:MAG: hypothetical protein Q9222_002012 [Ikaeria aurantiellina]